MGKFKEVTRAEYLTFIKCWPNKLEFDCTGICEPPLGSYNDFSGGKVWPESMVAKEVRDWIGPNGEIDNALPGKFWRYYVLETPNDALRGRASAACEGPLEGTVMRKEKEC